MNRLLLTCTRRMPQCNSYQFSRSYFNFWWDNENERDTEKDRKAMEELKIHVEGINKVQIIRDELKPSDIEETVEISTEISYNGDWGFTASPQNINVEEVHINRSVGYYYDLAEKIPCMRGKIDPIYSDDIAKTHQFTGTTFDLKLIAYIQGCKMIGLFKTTLINENLVRSSGIAIRDKI